MPKLMDLAILSLALPAMAGNAPREYPLQGKVTAIGTQKETSAGAVVALGVAGLLVKDTHKLFTITLDDGSTVTLELGEYSKQDKVPVIGEEISFREDAKGDHAWLAKPNGKGETKYAIVQTSQLPSK